MMKMTTFVSCDKKQQEIEDDDLSWDKSKLEFGRWR